VFAHLPRALAGHEEHIHQMRVATRRLRVALPLLATRPEGRRVRRALRVLRDLTRAAGASRDLDVAVGLFDRHRSGAEPLAESRLLRRRLLAARARSRRQLAEALMDIEIAGVRRDLRAILKRGGNLLFTALSTVRDACEAEGSRILSELERLGDAYDPDSLHRQRIRVRRLRYAVEVADDLRAQESEAPGRLRDLQELLGQIRDPFVLSTWLTRQAANAESRAQLGLATEARFLADAFLAQSHERHRQWLAANPAEVIRDALATAPGRTSAA
jgi:CHAD domain-containing protein